MTRHVSDSTLGYNAKDVIATWECYENFFGELDKPAAPGKNSFRQTYEHTLSLYEPCMYMQSRGLLVDIKALEAEKQNIAKRIGEIQEELNRLTHPVVLNPNSADQLKKYFYVLKGIPPYTKLNDKKEQVITCDDKALQRIARGTSARPGLREAALIQEFRKLSKLKGTYLDMVLDKDSRMRSSYNPRGTRFARLSSSKTIFETGGNQQNLHPAFLSFLVADPGCLFISLDKRQAEWVAVAYATGDQNMISAVEQGLDVHAWTGSQMCRVPIELVKEENKALGHESDPEIIREWRMNHPEFRKIIESGQWLPRTMSIRQCGKKSNHGLNYDESYRMFALINELTEREAKAIVDFYHRAYPGIRGWYEWIKRELQRNGRVLENFFGRPYRFLGAWDKDLWKSAYSYIPQSSVGELVNRGMAGVYYDRDPVLEQAEIMQQVHDSLLLQIPLDDPRLGEAVLKAKSHLEPKLESGGREFTIATDMKVGFNLRDMVEVPLVESGDQQAELMRTAAAKLRSDVGGTEGRGLDLSLS